jgi:hypothetical protein
MATMSGIKRFLDKTPGAVAYARDMKRAIVEKHISLKGKSEDVARRAYDWARRGWEGSIDQFFEDEDRRAAEKFEKEQKRNAKKS